MRPGPRSARPQRPTRSRAAGAPARRDGARTERLAVVACVAAVAVAFRLAAVGRDLPWFADEALPFRIALSLWGWGADPATANPHYFHYPSLAIYVHWLVQAGVVMAGLVTGRYRVPADAALELFVHPERFVVPARVLHVATDAAAAALTALVGLRVSRFTALAAGLTVAVVPVAVQGAAHLSVDPLTLLACAYATWALAAYARTGSAPSRWRAAVACGLAIGTKYSALPLLGALGAAWWLVRERRSAGALAAMLAVAAVTFVATTPYALLDPHTFAADTLYEWRHLATGHFGTGALPLTDALGTLARNLGVAGSLLLLAALVRPPGPQREYSVLRVTAVLLLAPVLLSHTFSARYLLPGLPAAAVVLALAAQSLLARLRARPWAEALALAAVVAPVAAVSAPGAFDRTPGAIVQAMSWCEAHLTPADVVVQEAGALPAVGAADRDRLARGRAFAGASESWRAQVTSMRVWPFLNMPFAASGVVSVPLRGAAGEARELPVYSPGWRANEVLYVPPVLSAATVYVSTSSIRARFEREPAAWPRVCAWYRALDATATERATFRLGRDPEEPAITIYRLRHAAGAAAPLARDWWLAGATPEALGTLGSGALAASTLGPAERANRQAARHEAFSGRWEVVLDQLAQTCGQAGRPAAARTLAQLVLRESPRSPYAVHAYVLATLETAPPAGRTPEALVDSLLAAGADPLTARREIEQLVRGQAGSTPGVR